MSFSVFLALQPNRRKQDVIEAFNSVEHVMTHLIVISNDELLKFGLATVVPIFMRGNLSIIGADTIFCPDKETPTFSISLSH